MNGYDEWMEIAEKMECMDEFEHLKEIVKDIFERSKTGVFITGARNSGKTTILNGITGRQIREPSILVEEAKPLRVSFDLVEEDSRFECHVAANKSWNEEDVVLYEVTVEEALQFLKLADVIYYVVSAAAPFTKEDVEAIKSMSCLKVKVVLNKMNLVDGESKEKVIAYANGISENLGLGSVLIVDSNDWEATAKAFRYGLPTFSERQMIRERYSRWMQNQLVKTFQKKAEQMLRINREAHEKSRKDFLNDDLEAQEALALWNQVRVQMLEAGDTLADQAEEKIKKETESMANVLFEEGKAVGFHQKWAEEQLPKHLMNRMKEILEVQIPMMEEQMKTDSHNMMKRLENLGLVSGFDLDEYNLANATNIYVKAHGVDARNVKMEMGEMDSDIHQKTLIAMGLFLICPFPSNIISITGALVTAGIGYGMYKREKNMLEEKRWKIILNEYCKENINILTDNMITSIKNYYYQLADFIFTHANDVKIPQMDDEAYSQEEKKWNEVIQKCQMLYL